MAFDIKNSAFWMKDWGDRPSLLEHAIAIADAAVKAAPVLIPVYSHRYLPALPTEAGNPVLSVYQTDIIYYGRDLRSYLRCEFGGLEREEAVKGEPRTIPFWTKLLDANC